MLQLLVGNVDTVVLARYMRVLTGKFLTELGVPVINIHHSFLPAFIGAGPYRKAKERGSGTTTTPSSSDGANPHIHPDERRDQ